MNQSIYKSAILTAIDLNNWPIQILMTTYHSQTDLIRRVREGRYDYMNNPALWNRVGSIVRHDTIKCDNSSYSVIVRVRVVLKRNVAGE